MHRADFVTPPLHTDLSLRSLGDYPLRQADTEDRFYGNWLIYLGWDNHLMFAAPLCVPLPPQMPFGLLVAEVLPELFGEHPEFEAIDWSRAQWFNSHQRFHPDLGKSLKQHGFGHKTLIRFKTPALEGSRRQSTAGQHAF